jgi:hypothetical protein
MAELYKTTFPVGSQVRIISGPALDEFARRWSGRQIGPPNWDRRSFNPISPGTLLDLQSEDPMAVRKLQSKIRGKLHITKQMYRKLHRPRSQQVTSKAFIIV